MISSKVFIFIHTLFFRCFPRLNEGDQLVLINGRDVADHSHDQVVNFIRACSEPHSGQIELAVKQVRIIYFTLISTARA